MCSGLPKAHRPEPQQTRYHRAEHAVPPTDRARIKYCTAIIVPCSGLQQPQNEPWRSLRHGGTAPPPIAQEVPATGWSRGASAKQKNPYPFRFFHTDTGFADYQEVLAYCRGLRLSSACRRWEAAAYPERQHPSCLQQQM